MTAIVPRLPAAPRIVTDGPRVRLGLAWAAIAVVATSIGATAAAVVFAAVALGAAGQSCRAWRKHGRRPHPPVAIGGAVAVAFSAAAGFIAMAIVAVIAGAAAVAVQQTKLGGKEWDASLTATIALFAGVAAGSVPLARRELGFMPALVLLLTVLLAEASWFLIGSGARTRFDAPLASTAAVIAMSIAAAAVLVPPFRGASPWVLGGVAAVLTPLGPIAASAVLPRPDAFAPALRRIDGFVLVGPVWTLVAYAVLDLR